eukprot:327959-Rhodomonas_salina.3
MMIVSCGQHPTKLQAVIAASANSEFLLRLAILTQRSRPSNKPAASSSPQQVALLRPKSSAALQSVEICAPRNTAVSDQ